MTDERNDELMRRKDAAAYLAVCEETMRRWAAAGAGPAVVRFGTRAVRYRKSDVQSWASEMATK